MLEFINFKLVAGVTFWCVIFVRAFQLKSLRLYPFFYFYAGIEALSTIAALIGASAWGLEDQRYATLYFIRQVTLQLATALLLIWLISLPKGFRFRREVPVLAAFLAVSIFFESRLPSGSHIIWRLSSIGGFFLLLVACQAIYRCFTPLGFEIGRNMGVVLVAVFVMLFLEFMNSTLYLTRLWEYESFSNLRETVSVAAWGIIAWAMLDLDKPKSAQ